MKRIISLIKQKSKMFLIFAVVMLVIISIYLYNLKIKNENTELIKSANGTFVIASGVVEDNSLLISSEITGTMVEQSKKEGEFVKKGDVIAKIDDKILQNQYKQAQENVRIAEKNVETITNNLNFLEQENGYKVQQAEHAYLSAQAEYKKVMDGASAEIIAKTFGELTQAKLNFDKAQKDFERNKALFESGVISKSQFEASENAFNQAQAAYENLNKQLEILKAEPTDAEREAALNKMLEAKSAYELAAANGNSLIQQTQNQLEIAKLQLEQAKQSLLTIKDKLDKTVIKSPINGVINTLFYNVGELVAAGKSIGEVVDPNNIEVKVYVSELNIGHIKVGQDATLYVDSVSNKGFKGKVIKINEEAEFTPKNIQTREERINTVYEVKIKVLNPEGIIKPGMPIDAHIRIR
ncbi:MAG: rane fusion protein YbhG [Clostridium butyricum]|nr:rane fusion protein YbhG [Thermoanaerobacterium sp.]MDK2829223.1 rane fusion protein YbhG [Clostridium butyricum]MDK2840362.1 rane fusion protein YbhG [Thermosipho sp. (in: thermotogales)]